MIPFHRLARLGPNCARFAVSALLAGGALAPAHAQQPAAGPAVPVTVSVVARHDLPILLGNIGAVQPNQSVLIRTRVDGTLQQLFFTEGQEVKQGQKIAQVDPRPYQAVLDQAQAKLAADQAQLANAQRDLARYSQLERSQFASRQSVDTQTALVAQLTAQLKSDRAAIEAAQVNLDYTTITAPFDGRMGLRQMDVGTVMRLADTSGAGIVTISQIHPVAVVFSLPQESLPAIQKAMAAARAQGRALAVTAFGAEDHTRLAEGRLLTIDNAIDTTSGTIKLKALFDNADNALWPGQFVNASLKLGERVNVVAVPSVGVQHGPNFQFVYVVKPDDTVELRKVQVGADDGVTAMIAKGLEPGEKIVVNGQSRLRAGARVTIAATRASS